MEATPLVLQRRFPVLAGPDAGVVLHLTLNRPEVRNAMSLPMVEALLAALADAEREGDVRAIVLRGAGGHFCAGADLRDLAAARARPAADIQADGSGPALDPIAAVNGRFGALCAAFAATGIALVAVLEGAVMGGGFGLACVADVVLAGASTRFRLPETTLGVVPAQIAPFLVERLGYGEARRLAVTGGQIDAQAALSLRLVHAVHDDGDLDRALDDTLAGLLRCAPGAVAATKRLLRRARLEPAETLLADAALAFSAAVRGPEGIEGTMAFLQKRRPGWAPDPDQAR